jgi:DNA (cytosine-5)-methyltransferase 1
MNYLSVCSGIEAATVAWHHMGWKPVAFSEIEKFPSQVLQHHYPSVPNVGDMTKFEEWNLDSIDLLVGGTPCQSFSVAGLRKGLDDPRGNLMLTYGAIAKRFRPKWLVWENVPGVLSSNGGRDFATFLGMLAELGYGFAYRVLDAQYFGVAQRRRRVFVVGCLGDWRAAAAVLFERDSLCGNPAPSREKRERTTAGSPTSPQYGGSNRDTADTVTSKWAKGSGGPAGNECGLFVAQPIAWDEELNPSINIAGTIVRGDQGGRHDGVAQPIDVPEVMSTLLSSTAGVSRPGNAATEHETYIPMAYRKSKRAQSKDDDESWVEDEITNTINLFDQGDIRATQAILQPISIQDVRGIDKSQGGKGWNDNGTSYTLDTHATQGIAQPIPIDTMNHIGRKDNHSFGDFEPGAPSFTLTKGHSHAVATQMAVRRLTPVECERLQGFPDGYTNIKENCPDGPRYKALGNSMAVPVMRWIGERIQIAEEI